MFALLAPAGFAVVVGLKAKLDAHAQWKAAQQRQKKATELRGAAAGALPDAELEEWRHKAMLATERLKGLESLVQEMNRRLDEEGKARTEAEVVAGEKLLEIDKLKEEKDSLAQLAAEKECEADATAEAAAQLAEEADVAQKALFRVSDSILRWRDQLSVVSLTQETYGQEPTAQEVLHVIGDMDHEVQVSVLQESALPADLKLKLVAKRAELAAKQEAEKEKAEFDKACRAAAVAAVTSSSSSSSTAPPSFQHRHVLDAPDKLVRLMAMASAARSAAPATDGSADKENVHGAPQRTASGGVHPTGRPLASVMPNAARLVDDAQQQGPPLGAKRGGSPAAAKKRAPAGAIRAQPAPAAPPCDPPAMPTAAPERAVPSRLTLVELSDDKSSILAPGCDLTLPGELPGASSDAWADQAPLSLVPFLPSLKLSRAHTLPKRNVQGRRGGGSVDRRTALTAAVAAFESEEAVLVPRLALR